MAEASMGIESVPKGESIFGAPQEVFREAFGRLGLPREAQSDAWALFMQGRNASETNPRIAQIGERALSQGQQVVDLKAQRKTVEATKPGALKEKQYQARAALEKTCGELVAVLDPHLSAIPSRRAMAEAVVGLAQAIREERQGIQPQTTTWPERAKTRVQKAYANLPTVGGQKFGHSLGGAAMMLALLLGASGCGGQAAEKPPAVAPAPGGDKGGIGGFLERAKAEIDKRVRVQQKYYSNPAQSEAEASAQQKVDHYLRLYQEGTIGTSPWQIDQPDVEILAVSYGPGWWAKVPRLKEPFETFAGRKFTDPEWQSFADDPAKAQALIQELYAMGKIDQKAYEFYMLSPDEMRAKVESTYPSLLPGK